MIFAVILAGGTGSRMGSTDMPKQFLEIKGKPILNHTVEKFLPNPKFEKIIVLSPKSWIGHTREIIRKFTGKNDRIAVIEGGSTRNETIMNAIRYIDREYGLDDDTVIVTHDSVRPFVTHRIIEENIKTALNCGACDTVIPATDTIVEGDGTAITNIPDRRKMYQGQTPQSFKAKLLRDTYESLSDEEKDILTDAAKILVMKGKEVRLVQGETFNIKITYPYDLKIARSLLDTDS
ncbi:MAG: 2-C-methyl-D-erythritol 4-phosphate cytidylyltransferase [Ruminococcus sp.]|uniref:IspD/TarI family cytidylyltransferase n=1 Tax=Ruminococcus sp. TaxID=41978 RepID=UPI002873AB6B|nr:2-C-methyl-D-erythritol 4-phosphate cytidylyltransferase [Ruminococcus sp.]MBQ3284264.1 2-C-methyl-D-erythritol 4-phosphate cytidylyltransferase [Ruminococcus sp.]